MTHNPPVLPGMEPPPLVPGPVSLAIAAMIDAADDGTAPAWTRDPLHVAMIRTCAGNVDRAEREGSSWAVANAVRALASLLESITPAAPADPAPVGEDDHGLAAFLDGLGADVAAGA